MNIYTITDARLVEDPKEIELGGNKLTKIRVADNPPNKERNLTRYVDCLVGNRNAPIAARLAKGDVITITGNLVQREYEASGNGSVKKGTMLRSDEMPFVDNITIQKSPSFFGHPAVTGEQPAAEAGPDTTSPLPF